MEKPEKDTKNKKKETWKPVSLMYIAAEFNKTW
jgi:hypothetical protein